MLASALPATDGAQRGYFTAGLPRLPSAGRPCSRRKAGQARHRAKEGPGLNTLPLQPDPVIEAYKKGVDRTLIRENLRRSVEERFLNLIALQRLAEELRRAGRDTQRQP